MTHAIRLLLVEDDDVARDGFRAALEQAGFLVEVCEDGGEGLVALRQTPGRFAAVITDVNLPSLSGPEMIAQAGDALGAARVIYLSGYTDGGVGLPAGAGVGAQAVMLAKPIAKDDLVKAVRNAAG